MKLSRQEIKAEEKWLESGVELPKFDYEKTAENTHNRPTWIHFGAGNIFRAFQANLQQRLLDEGLTDTGLIVAEGYDYEIVTKMNAPHDNLSLLVTLKASGKVDKKVIASVTESYALDSHNVSDFGRVKEIFASPSLQMVSFTITEKGYSLVNGKGEYLESVKYDAENGVNEPDSYIGKVVALLYHRFKSGSLPIAMVSMDNCSHNGDKLKQAVMGMTKLWLDGGFVEQEFIDYLNDENKVTFPWSMIDKITPRPDATVMQMLEECGVEGMEPIITSKNTYIAPYVNAEECEYLVIEDAFPNGRPPLDKAGVYFTDRETVDKVEKMKVCTCLNPLHTALAIYGCVLGYTKISEEFKDEDLVKLAKNIGYIEGMPVVVDPGIISPKDFLAAVVNERIPNPFMPDTPQRIATDTSQKLPIRFGETIKKYMESQELEVTDLRFIPLVFAGWLRYLMAIDDNGNSFELSSDPLLDELLPIIKNITFGEGVSDRAAIEKILSNGNIFGVNLFEAGLAEKVIEYFGELNAGCGSVRTTLKKYLNI